MAKRSAPAVAAVVSTLVLAIPAGAADYFERKTIDLIAGGEIGGGVDIYARRSPAISGATSPASRRSWSRT